MTRQHTLAAVPRLSQGARCNACQHPCPPRRPTGPAGEIGEEYEERRGADLPVDDLMALVDQIVPYDMTHNAGKAVLGNPGGGGGGGGAEVDAQCRPGAGCQASAVRPRWSIACCMLLVHASAVYPPVVLGRGDVRACLRAFLCVCSRACVPAAVACWPVAADRLHPAAPWCAPYCLACLAPVSRSSPPLLAVACRARGGGPAAGGGAHLAAGGARRRQKLRPHLPLPAGCAARAATASAPNRGCRHGGREAGDCRRAQADLQGQGALLMHTHTAAAAHLRSVCSNELVNQSSQQPGMPLCLRPSFPDRLPQLPAGARRCDRPAHRLQHLFQGKPRCRASHSPQAGCWLASRPGRCSAVRRAGPASPACH